MVLFSDLGSLFLFSLIRLMVKSCLNLDHIGTRLNMLSHWHTFFDINHWNLAAKLESNCRKFELRNVADFACMLGRCNLFCANLGSRADACCIILKAAVECKVWLQS